MKKPRCGWRWHGRKGLLSPAGARAAITPEEGLTWNMPMQRQLLTIAAVVESLAGLVLILAPKVTVASLLGAEPNVAGVKIGRVCGVALTALGIACWGARTDSGSAARSGTLKAITFYNAGAGLLLVLFAAIGKTGGIVLWSAGVIHLALAAAFTISFRRPKDTSSTKFGTTSTVGRAGANGSTRRWALSHAAKARVV